MDLLKLPVHHRPPIFTWTGFLFRVRGLEGLVEVAKVPASTV